MSEKEAVVEETNAQVAEVEKRTEAEVPLEQLLAEFDQGTAQPVSQPEPSAKVDLSKIKDQVKAEIKAEQDNTQAIKNLVKSVRGEIPEDVLADDEIEDWLEGQAKRNQQLATAWMQRQKNPGAWAKVERGLSEKLNNKWKTRIDPDATADHAAVAQAVRGASTRVAAEPPPDLSRMSNAELARFTRDNYGF